MKGGVEGPEKKRQGREGLPEEESHRWDPDKTPISGSGVRPLATGSPSTGRVKHPPGFPPSLGPSHMFASFQKYSASNRPPFYAPVHPTTKSSSGEGRRGPESGPGGSQQTQGGKGRRLARPRWGKAERGSRGRGAVGGKDGPEKGEGERLGNRTASLAVGHGQKLTQHLPRTGPNLG